MFSEHSYIVCLFGIRLGQLSFECLTDITQQTQYGREEARIISKCQRYVSNYGNLFDSIGRLVQNEFTEIFLFLWNYRAVLFAFSLFFIWNITCQRQSIVSIISSNSRNVGISGRICDLHMANANHFGINWNTGRIHWTWCVELHSFLLRFRFWRCGLISEFRYKSIVVYYELDAKIERLSNFFRNFVFMSTPAIVLIPPILLTFTNYFIYELHDEPYEDLLLA